MNLPEALHYRDFRLLWLGQVISVAGSQMRTVAVTWHLYKLTGSPLVLGAIGLARLLPMVVLGLGAGVMADRIDRRRLMLATNVTAALASAGLAFITWRDVASPTLIYILLALSSAAATFDLPARQALIPALVPREVLPGALSLNVVAWQLASVFGPVLGGVALTLFDVGTVYAIDGVSFLAVVVAVLMMSHREDRSAASTTSPVTEALAGIRFVVGQPLILGSMLLDFFATLFGAATTMLPIFADQILHVDERGLGLLYAAPAAGAVVAGGYLASRLRITLNGPTLIWSVVLYGLSTAAFGASRSFPLALLMLAVAGGADAVSAVTRSTMRHLLTPDEMRGRMTSVNMLFFAGGPQLGEVEAGLAASWMGTARSVIFGGFACIIATALIAKAFPQLVHYKGPD